MWTAEFLTDSQDLDFLNLAKIYKCYILKFDLKQLKLMLLQQLKKMFIMTWHKNVFKKKLKIEKDFKYIKVWVVKVSWYQNIKQSLLSNRGNIKIHRKGQNRCLETHMFTGRAVPVAVGNDHQRRTKTGRVEGSVTFITEQQLQHTTKEINIIQSKETIFNVLKSNVEYFSIVRQDF